MSQLRTTFVINKLVEKDIIDVLSHQRSTLVGDGRENVSRQSYGCFGSSVIDRSAAVRLTDDSATGNQ